ncbi:MAG TPA: HAD family phosphatase [Flavisolibacter sp.]|jgi:2-haloacid dehalogenase|nr:HAD family phosphatase [Flavisolibacter sp.]
MNIDTMIFDLGNVLVRWDPDNLYKKIFAREEERNNFLQNICTMEWHTLQDAGRSPQEGTDALVKQYPHYEEAIRAFYTRWEEMFNGPIEGTVQILKEVKEKGYKVYALSNWNAELYQRTVNDFPFLNWFDGKIISSEEKMKKPDENIYHLLFERFAVDPARAVFIDDNVANIATAERLGLSSILFTTPEALRKSLQTLNII